MKHADEGTLHAYLDGELSPDEVTELERHLSVCVPCRALLNEARGFLAESDSLVLALDIPGEAKPYRAPRRIPYSTLAWAAMVVLALGTGYALRPALGPQMAARIAAAPTPTEATATVQAAPSISQPAQTPATRTPSRQAPPAAPSATDQLGPRFGELGGVAASGAGGVAERSAEQRQDLAVAPTAPAPSPVAAAPAPVAAEAQAPSNYAFIDGTPVDTTGPRLNFGRRATMEPRRITLDEAVTHLGGTIRLIDGLAPQRVELLSGVDVAGADPDRMVVRVYYEEPDLGLVTLDQQRPGPSFAARDSRARRAESDVAPSQITVNPTPAPSASGAMLLRGGFALNSVSWRTDGTWLSLSSRLTGTALAQLQARVK